MINKILIANRGEIACRIIKTCQRLEITSVAVYSEADKNALFVEQADEAYFIGESDATSSYLNIDKLISIAKKANVCAVHPGYGFLSENVLFAEKLQQNNLIFIGPKIKSLSIMGSKSTAKQCMVDAGIPVTPGYHGSDQSLETLSKEASRIGYPVLLKAALGGGGKGMRVVLSAKEFPAALDACKREAKKSFADDTVLIEKFLEKPRHIEVQIFADTHQQVVHLFERDCSVQRRHQKIIEEAPAINLSQPLKDKLYDAAIKAAKACDYVGAGTIEFLVEGDELYFMEMNTRLQVEHPVTEMITGIDLVEWQIVVASGDKLPLQQSEIKQRGHAIEVRLYAEDPDNQFLPQTGRITYCHWPNSSANVRIDTGIRATDDISIYYDPMMAKLITHANSRQDCVNQMTSALKRTHITGIKHNRQYLLQVLKQQNFKRGDIDINYIKKHPISSIDVNPISIIAGALYQKLKRPIKSLWQTQNTWRLNSKAQDRFMFQINKDMVELTIESDGGNYQVLLNDKQYVVEASIREHGIDVQVDSSCYRYTCLRHKDCLTVIDSLSQIDLKRQNAHSLNQEEDEGQLSAPMPGNVIAILCKETDNVDKGQALMIIEAMKMEHTITSPISGKVDEIFFKLGSKVAEGDTLISMVNA